jgi:ATP-dependent protease HslVU (ClpYQ) peptidase subunit
MTCIVGFVEGNRVWMGGDSAGVAGLDLTVRADTKIFRNGEMLFGFTTSFRMGQLLRYSLAIPEHDDRVPVEKWMATTFVNAVRECLKVNGWAQKEKEQESGGNFLVGYKGELFEVWSDYQVARPVDGFAAVGCGAQIAHGALFATSHIRGKKRALIALSAAERFSAGVRGPFHVETLA